MLYGMLIVVIVNRLEGRPDVLGAGVADDVVDGVENVAAALGQDIQALDDMAAVASMSRYHFSRQFKSTCGFSPYEYLILTRINRAKHLLKATSLPVKVVAQEVGYHSEAAFTNAFTDRVGLSPSQFRKYPI